MWPYPRSVHPVGARGRPGLMGGPIVSCLIRSVPGLLALCFALGCVTRERVRSGDAALLSEHPRAAVRHYEAALASAPRLADDPAFAARLRRARAGAARSDGQRHASAGAWHAAIAAYAASVDMDPQCDETRAALALARREGSRVHQHEARALADRNELDAAVQCLVRAVEIDASNADARAALESMRQRRRERHERAAVLHDHATGLAQQRRWREAAAAYERVLLLDPDHLDARAAVQRMRGHAGRSDAARAEGRRRLERRELDGAIASLEAALDHWPYDEEAARLLDLARARRDDVRRLLADAAADAVGADWDGALDSAARARVLFPGHEPARQLVERVRYEAASSLTHDGRRLLAASALQEARSAFARALHYAPDHAPAVAGLVEVDLADSGRASARGAWGAALLAAMNAAAHEDAPPAAAATVDAARARVRRRMAFGVALDGGPGAEEGALAAAARAALAERRLPTVHVAADAGDADFAVHVDDVHVGVDAALAGREARAHQYTRYETVSNPRLARLEGERRGAEQRLARLRHRRARKCHVCAGAGTVICTSCRGRGSMQCTRCKGGGEIEQRSGDETCPRCLGRSRNPARCSACGGRGSVRVVVREGKTRRRVRQPCRQCSGPAVLPVCPTCGGSGKVRAASRKRPCAPCAGRGSSACGVCHGKRRVSCGHCDGSGHDRSVGEHALQRQRDQVQELRRELAREPATIAHAIVAEWPYEIERHRIAGRLTCRLSVVDQAAGRAVVSRPIATSFVMEDTVVVGANTTIGLAPDELELPSTADVRAALFDRAAAMVAEAVLDSVIRARRAVRLSEGGAHAAEGGAAHALEAEVDAALLLEVVDPVAAGRQLHALRARMAGGR